MGSITQPFLFSWKIVERSPEILRLARVLEAMPDGALLAALEAERKERRDDYPIVAVWNSLIAGIVFGHPGIASLIRELHRNAELREVCGFDPLKGEAAVPPDYVYSRLLKKLIAHEAEVRAMFEALVERVRQLLPDFGVDLAIDGKALATWGRKDADAKWGQHTTRGTGKDGKPYETIKRWFGYTLHLIVDTRHELPVAFEVTPANQAESPRLLPLIEHIESAHPELHERIESLAGDRGYDDGADKAALWDDHDIAPVVDSRDCYTNTGGERWRPLDEQRHDTIYIGPTGEVACKVEPFAPEEEKRFAAMQFMGFEPDRQALKFRCPAAARGVACNNRAACACRPSVREGDFGRVVRVPLTRDRRLLLPVHRHSRRFRQLYRGRTAIERVNSRIDQVYGFERHFIRGQAKMTLRVTLALAVMLATAVGWIEAEHPEHIRSLLCAA